MYFCAAKFIENFHAVQKQKKNYGKNRAKQELKKKLSHVKTFSRKNLKEQRRNVRNKLKKYPKVS